MNLVSIALADWKILIQRANAQVESFDVKLRGVAKEKAAASSSNSGDLGIEDRLLLRALSRRRKEITRSRKKVLSSLKNAEAMILKAQHLRASLRNVEKGECLSLHRSENRQNKSMNKSMAFVLNQDVQTIICFFLNCEDVASFGTCAKSLHQVAEKNALWMFLFESRFFPVSTVCAPSSWCRPTAHLHSALESHHVAALADAEDAVACALATEGTTSTGVWKRVYKWFLFGLVHVRLQVFNRETERSNEFKMSCYTASVTFRRISEGYIYSRNGEPLGSMESVSQWEVSDRMKNPAQTDSPELLARPMRMMVGVLSGRTLRQCNFEWCRGISPLSNRRHPCIVTEPCAQSTSR